MIFFAIKIHKNLLTPVLSGVLSSTEKYKYVNVCRRNYLQVTQCTIYQSSHKDTGQMIEDLDELCNPTAIKIRAKKFHC